MSPQPAQPTAEKPAEAEKAKGKTDAEKAAEEAADQAWNELVERASTTGGESPQTQVQRAIKLEAERVRLQERIAKNRTYLRLMDENEELNDDQQEFVDVFYAEKAKGEPRNSDELAATKRARRLAAANGKS